MTTFAPTTILAAGLELTGELSGAEDVQIDGRVDGRINLDGQLYVQAAGHVQADVRAKELWVEGTLIGDVQVDGRVTVLTGGKLVGNVTAEEFVLAEDAAFRGRVNVGAEPAPVRANISAGLNTGLGASSNAGQTSKSDSAARAPGNASPANRGNGGQPEPTANSGRSATPRRSAESEDSNARTPAPGRASSNLKLAVKARLPPKGKHRVSN